MDVSERNEDPNKARSLYFVVLVFADVIFASDASLF